VKDGELAIETQRGGRGKIKSPLRVQPKSKA
jgi:hypothetical protein